VALSRLHSPNAGLISATIVGAVLCLLARWRDWHLPESHGWRPSDTGGLVRWLRTPPSRGQRR